MQELCQNGTDYEECENKVKRKGEFCGDCQEKSFESFTDHYFGGSVPVTSKERRENEKKN